MKNFVISLTRSTDRRSSINAMMKELDIDFSFFDAVDAKQQNAHSYLFDKYSEKKRILLRGSPLQAAEIACFASHYCLWEKCIELNEAIIILEDDCVLNHDFKAVTAGLNKIFDVIPDALIRLHHLRENPSSLDILPLENGYSLQRFIKMAGGTIGYIISPSAAKKLIVGAEFFTDTVDDYLDREGLHFVKMLGIKPSLVGHDEVESTIGDRSQKIQISLSGKLRRESIRLLYDAKTIFNRAKFILHLPKIQKKLLENKPNKEGCIPQ